MAIKLSINLRLYMARSGVTAAALSRQTGVPKATISDWMNGSSPKNLVHLKSVADFFSISVDQLLFGDFSAQSPRAESFPNQAFLKAGVFEVYLKPVDSLKTKDKGEN